MIKFFVYDKEHNRIKWEYDSLDELANQWINEDEVPYDNDIIDGGFVYINSVCLYLEAYLGRKVTFADVMQILGYYR